MKQMVVMQAMMLVLLGCAGLQPTPAVAGRYELAKFWYTGIHSTVGAPGERDLELCKAYERNLNLFPERKDPLACESPIHPESKDFSKPQWTVLDPMKYIELMVQAEALSPSISYALSNMSEAEREKWAKSARETAKINITQPDRVKVEVAKLNAIDRQRYYLGGMDGPTHHVLRIEWNTCDAKAMYAYPGYRRGTQYYLVDEALTQVQKPFAQAAWGGEVFLYKGKAYFETFSSTRMVDPDHLGKKKSSLILDHDRYEINIDWLYNSNAAHACRFRYIP